VFGGINKPKHFGGANRPNGVRDKVMGGYGKKGIEEVEKFRVSMEGGVP